MTGMVPEFKHDVTQSRNWFGGMNEWFSDGGKEKAHWMQVSISNLIRCAFVIVKVVVLVMHFWTVTSKCQVSCNTKRN